MSYYENEIICPKCGHYSTDLETCEHCGALIARIREREEQRSSADRASDFDDQAKPQPTILTPEPGVSYSALILVLLLMVGIGAAIYSKNRDEDGADAPTAAATVSSPPPAATATTPLPADATPYYNFSKSESTASGAMTAQKLETTTAASAQSDGPGMFATIAETLKAQSQPTANEPASPQQPPATPAATPPPASATVSTPPPTPKTSSANSPLAPINIGELDISSVDFSRKASEYKPAPTANTPAPTPAAPSASASKAPALKRPVVAVNSRSFSQEVLFHRAEPVLVDFYATWCGPCKRLAPQLEVFAGLNDGVKVVKIDIDQNKDLAKKYKIVSVPTLILFKDGKMLGRNSGVPSMAQLQASIKPHL